MKIAFFSEANFTGKIPRDFNNMRTEYSWYVALDADHYPINSYIKQPEEQYDLGIMIIPKKGIDKLMQGDLIDQMRRLCKKIAVMQEGPHDYFQDYPLEHQIWYYNTLMECDVLFAHNRADARYYRGITNKPTFVLRSLIIEDAIPEINTEKEDKVIIGGNFCKWYGGFDSYVVASNFDLPIYAPSMGRKIDFEEEMDNLTHLPYMTWSEWMVELSKFKYAIHLMRTHAAGTFALNCARLGVPCIGYKGLDTQELLFPSLSVDLGDIESAKKISDKLQDESYHKDVVNAARANYELYFHENAFLNRWREIEYSINGITQS